MTTIAARLDGFGRLGWIAVVIAGFMLWWPIGLIILGYLIGSGRMGCFMMQSAERMQEQMEWMQRRMQEKMDRMTRGGWCGPRAWASTGRSGNRAFDEYRSETLRRLEDEEREFRDFLDRLRQAKDKTEFDQFMAERRHRDETPPSPQPQS
jgi:hypothetical protein